MKITLTTSMVAHHLLRDENARWSYEGAYALARHYEEMEEESGEEIELDVVAIRCEWTEYKYLQDIADDYRIPDLDGLSDDEKDEAIKVYIHDNTQMLVTQGKTYLVMQF